MIPVSTCPDADQFHQLLRGALSDDQAEPLEEHLTHCDRCGQLVRTLTAEDEMAATVRAGVPALADAEHPLVQSVIQRARQFDPRTGDPRPADTDPGRATPFGPVTGHPTTTGDDLAFLAPPQAPDELGRLDGYRVLEVLGRGGMGIVLRAEDVRLRRQVALKVMGRRVAADAQARERFLLEARAGAALNHDHVVTIHHVGEEGSVPFLAMELLEGSPLDRWLADGGRATVPQMIRIGRQVADGLAAAHARGLVHRDIKPANIWLERPSGDHGAVIDGRVKILDFGLARFSSDSDHLTSLGSVVGTPAYMSPEQARGEDVGARSDLFSLGCLLYRLGTGAEPFTGKSTNAVLMQLATHTPRPMQEHNPAVLRALSDLVDRLLAKRAEDRPATAREVARDLAAIEAAAAAPASQQPRGRRIAIALGGAVVLLVATAVFFRSRMGRPETSGSPGDGPAPIVAVEPTPQPPLLGPPPRVVAAIPPALPASASPFDALRPADIPDEELAAAGNGDPAQAPRELVAVLRQTVHPKVTVEPAIGFDLSPDGTTVAYNFGGPQVFLWDAATRQTRTLKLPAGIGPLPNCPCLAFSPDGKLLALSTGKSSGHFIIWDVDKQTVRHSLTLPGGYGQCVAFGPDAKTLATLGLNRQLHLWNVATGRQDNALGESISGPVIASADGCRLAARSGERLALLDLVSKQPARIVELSARTFRFRRDGQVLAAADSPQGWVKLIDPADGKILAGKQLTLEVIESVAYQPDGKRLATRCSRGIIRLWDPTADRVERTIVTNVRGHLGAVRFAPDGRHLITANRGGTIYVLRLAGP